jgi:hypothetical protein
MSMALFVVAVVAALAADAVVLVRALPEFARFVVTPRVIDIDVVEGCNNLLSFAFQHVAGTRSRLMIFEFLVHGMDKVSVHGGVGCQRDHGVLSQVSA